jgi:hypothetical protein
VRSEPRLERASRRMDPTIPANQLRTLQRRVREWRTAVARRLIVGTFGQAPEEEKEEALS